LEEGKVKTTPETIIRLIKENKNNPQIKAIADSIIKTNGIVKGDYPRTIDAVARWVHNNIEFKYDPENTDVMFEPMETIRMGRGDCEDNTCVASSLLGSLGIPTNAIIVSKQGEVWDHVFLRAGYPPANPIEWMSVDATIEPPSRAEIPFKKEMILSTDGKTSLGNPGLDLIELAEAFIAPGVTEEINKQTNAYPVAWLQSYAEKMKPVTERPHVPYKVYAIPGDEINAFAIPGGATYIYEGLLNNFGKDVICGVLGHEMAHVSRKHCINSLITSYGIEFLTGLIEQGDMQEIARSVMNIIQLGYSREQEYEADKYSIHYNNKVGLYPFGIKKFLEWATTVQDEPTDPITKKIQGYLSTHPYTSDRLKAVAAEIARLGIIEKIKIVDTVIQYGKWLLPIGVGAAALVGGALILRRK